VDVNQQLAPGEDRSIRLHVTSSGVTQLVPLALPSVDMYQCHLPAGSKFTSPALALMMSHPLRGKKKILERVLSLP